MNSFVKKVVKEVIVNDEASKSLLDENSWQQLQLFILRLRQQQQQQMVTEQNMMKIVNFSNDWASHHSLLSSLGPSRGAEVEVQSQLAVIK